MHRQAGAAQVQFVGDAGGQGIFVVADAGLEGGDGLGQRRVGEPGEQVGTEVGASKDADEAAVPFRVVAGQFQRFPGALQKVPVLGVE